MLSCIARILGVGLLVVMLIAQPASVRPAQADDGPRGNQFVKQAGPQLRLNGKSFRFAGTNNYYLMYKSQAMVDDVLQSAAAGHFTVLRMWGSLDIGNQDGSNSISGKADGVYFQYFDPATSAPAYNDGDDGLKRLDYVIYRAGQLGIRLVIPFVNNWNDFGGMDQYVRWAGGQYHDQFYSDPVIRQWYKNWIAHLLNRTNSFTGVQYKNDPTIMTWELGNEPRCLSAGKYPRSNNCTTQTLIDWANDVSTYIKTIDENHLVSVGDEGFYCIPGATDWTENCGEGVDTLAFTRLPNINVMSFHLYPDSWGKDAAWGTQWIARHFKDAAKLNKPAMLGEFGLLNKDGNRNPVYKDWTDTVFKSGGVGALYWILSGKQDDGSYYSDYDGFTVYAFNPVFITLTNFAKMMNANLAMVFPPVADNDIAVTEFETPATIPVLVNDITYGGATLSPVTVDLDPSTPGTQTNISVYGGDYLLQADGSIAFTPTSGFSGKSAISYTVKDSLGRTSNIAAVQVTVKPNPAGTLTLFSFETGTEGWGFANWQDPTGVTVEQSTDWASDGTHSLKLVSTKGWFHADLNPALNLSNKTHIKYDVKFTGSGSNMALALQIGDSWLWCQNWIGWTDASDQPVTVDVDLLSLSCPNANLSDIRGINIWFDPGTFYIDNIIAQ